MKTGYFEHWFRPPYQFAEFLAEMGIDAEKIDYSKKNYLEGYDVVIIEQNGFNDYIENDEIYINDWVKRGGVLLFMHQDYKRWAPYFLNGEMGHTQLIHRYIETINGFSCAADKSFTGDDSAYMSYMMPWPEEGGKRLFSEPEVITPDEMLNWKLDSNTFGILRFTEDDPESEEIRSTAESCFLLNDKWEILGSFMDPSVKDGALIAKANYGKGMFFLNQILFPEILNSKAERVFSFWRKYIKNLYAYIERFKKGEAEIIPQEKKELPLKKNYKLAIHMHSLDWYGADSAPGTINAIMRYMNFDICALSVKDNAPYDGKLSTEKYSDDKVLFLDGQEYHPFNWNDKYDKVSHNTYHGLAIGINPDAYTAKYTRSLFSDEEIAESLKESIDYVHKNGGAICATHPNVDYWTDYEYDAVDKEPLIPLSGSDIEKYWLSGRKIALMVSVDLFGMRRIFDNPAANFLYLKGEKPSRDAVVNAIKKGHTIAATGFNEADIEIGGYLPGDTIKKEELSSLSLKVSAEIMRNNIKKLRVYSDSELAYQKDFDSEKIEVEIPLSDFSPEKLIRVEIEGENEHWICNSTPFYIK